MSVPGASCRRTRRAEEAKFDLLADDQAELQAGDVGLGAFFHAEGRHAEGLDRRAHARDGGHRGLDADVIGSGRAAANAHTFAAADHAVGRRSAGHGQVEVVAGERSHLFAFGILWPSDSSTSRQAFAQRFGLEDAAVEKDRRRQAGRLRLLAFGFHFAVGELFRLPRQEIGEVPGDGRVGDIRQAEFLQARGALPGWVRQSRAHSGKKPSSSDFSISARVNSPLIVPPMTERPRPSTVTGAAASFGIAEDRFFRLPRADG